MFEKKVKEFYYSGTRASCFSISMTKFSLPLKRVMEGDVPASLLEYTAILRKAVGRDVHATIPKDNMGDDQYTVPDTVAVQPTFVAFF